MANRDVKSIILSVIDKYSDESGMILVEDLYRHLEQRHGVDRVSAGKFIVELCREGKVYSPKYYYVKRTGRS